MDALITITTDEQGSSVVSARELHEFLGVKSKFADWIKNRIIKYKLLEGTDYVEVEGFSKTLEKGGRPELDYCLTMDTAKELSMVENNDKGREARRYFIQAEKALQQVATTPPAPDPLLLIAQMLQQQTQLLTEQGRRLEALEQQRPALPPARPPRALPSSPAAAPHLRGSGGLRQSINQKVNAYCERWGATQSETYNYLYKRLMEVYSVNVYRLIRTGKESILDALERYGHLDRLNSLISAELDYQQ